MNYNNGVFFVDETEMKQIQKQLQDFNYLLENILSNKYFMARVKQDYSYLVRYIGTNEMIENWKIPNDIEMILHEQSKTEEK